MNASQLTFDRGRPSAWRRLFFQAAIALYRDGPGELMRSRCILLLTTIGRRSGQPRTTGVSFMPLCDTYVIFSGWGIRSDWYRNLLANPDVSIQVGRKTLRATAVPVSDPARRKELMRQMRARSARCGPPEPMRTVLRLTGVLLRRRARSRSGTGRGVAGDRIDSRARGIGRTAAIQRLNGVILVRRLIRGFFVEVTLALATAALAAGGVMAQAEAVEQPSYEVIDTAGSVEIRQYGPRLAAETEMGSGSSIEAGQDAAFMALADFIFATNRQGPEVAMTAPVAIEQATAPIAMTAPVAMEPGADGQVMRFFMPAEYTLETLPRPGDDRVRIVTVPAQILAVLRFPGEADDAEVAERKAELLVGLAASAWRPVGEPGLFGYDPPMTPPEDRRNEVFVEVVATGQATAAQTPENA